MTRWCFNYSSWTPHHPSQVPPPHSPPTPSQKKPPTGCPDVNDSRRVTVTRCGASFRHHPPPTPPRPPPPNESFNSLGGLTHPLPAHFTPHPAVSSLNGTQRVFGLVGWPFAHPATPQPLPAPNESFDSLGGLGLGDTEAGGEGGGQGVGQPSQRVK